jgi:hypothetical protein
VGARAYSRDAVVGMLDAVIDTPHLVSNQWPVRAGGSLLPVSAYRYSVLARRKRRAILSAAQRSARGHQ